MEKKKITKKEILKFLSFLCIAIALIAALSYALLTVDLEGSKISGITKPEVSISYEEKSNALDLILTPMSDEVGKAQTNYFEFKIDATGKIDESIPANIYISETEKTIGNENIKMYLTKVENDIETQVLSPTIVNELEKYEEENTYLLNTKEYVFTSNEKKTYADTYRLRVWLKEDAKIESNNYTTTTEEDGSITAEAVSANYQFKVNVSTKKMPTGAEKLIKKVGTGGLVAESHPATTQLPATTDYRYTGANPDNYINFNNETWRIIGVFDTDDGTGKIEKRIKIIRDSIGKIAWDSNNTNDWSNATLMKLLNTGDYYNRTGSYATNGLTEEAKTQISDAKWYLGGTDIYDSATTGLTSHFYGYERGETVYTGRSTNWIGKVGLMYPSDYGYATSGGTKKDRDACLAKELLNWGVSDFGNCKNNDWFNPVNNQWTIAPRSGNSISVLFVFTTGGVNSYSADDSSKVVRPSVYLKSDIKLTGEGTSSSPYEIK